MNIYDYYENLDRLSINIRALTGYDLEEICDLLAAGWELVPPKDLFAPESNLSDLDYLTFRRKTK